MAADSSTSLRTERGLTQQAFDCLLRWLDPDRDRAAKKYEDIRIRLTKVFEGRGCVNPEDLTDETIDRVASRLDDVAARYEGEPFLYFHGVARLIYLEYSRKRINPPQTSIATAPQEIEEKYDCLDECLSRLTPRNRELILLYYRHERRTKIDSRREIAQQLGVSPNALRIRAHRIKDVLGDCISECMRRRGGS
ncbi:MAG TPA: sigma-70 family RNA polymerase sigma factor [Blastocatellia bacterium]|nr:sigma-70 family RNA polymerase sigma factor [Blastocatellia bacterium]